MAELDPRDRIRSFRSELWRVYRARQQRGRTFDRDQHQPLEDRPGGRTLELQVRLATLIATRSLATDKAPGPARGFRFYAEPRPETGTHKPAFSATRARWPLRRPRRRHARAPSCPPT